MDATSDGASDDPLVLVDGEDRALGELAKRTCHLVPGRKHRAFTALAFDRAGRLLLARRAAGKMLWPGFWDGTVASHPRPGESYVASGRRRVREELGAEAAIGEHGRFDYEIGYADVGVENEVCCTLVGLVEPGELAPDAGEIDALAWIEPDAGVQMLAAEPERHCPWLYLALACVARPRPLAPELEPLVAPWRAALAGDPLAAARAHAFGDAPWRLLDEPS